eukprot:gene4633-20908_t
MKARPPPIPLDKRKPNLPRPLIDGGLTTSVEEDPEKKVDIVVSSEEGDDANCQAKDGCFIFKINHRFLSKHKIEYAALHAHKEGTTKGKDSERITIFLDEAENRAFSRTKRDNVNIFDKKNSMPRSTDDHDTRKVTFRTDSHGSTDSLKARPNDVRKMNQAHQHRQKRDVEETSRESFNEGGNATRLALETEATVPENGWFTVFVNDIVGGWQHQMSGNSVKHRVQIKGANLTITTKIRYRPFMVLKLKEKSSRRRTRRSYAKECVPGYDKCCLRKLFVRFRDINWHDWIIKPDGYQVNYCEGRCTGTGITSARSHAFIKRNLIASRKHPDLQTCCVPLKFEPLTLLHHDDDGTILKSSLQNMSVLECGCV